jgi:hypothetical protein
MGSFSRLLRILAVLSAVVTGALALWHRRDKVKQVWNSLGGTEGVMSSANRLAASAGPMKDFVAHISQLKK